MEFLVEPFWIREVGSQEWLQSWTELHRLAVAELPEGATDDEIADMTQTLAARRWIATCAAWWMGSDHSVRLKQDYAPDPLGPR